MSSIRGTNSPGPAVPKTDRGDVLPWCAHAAPRHPPTVEIDPDGMEILDAAACRSLLGTVRLGRLAVSHRALPIIVPVAFVAMDRGVAIDASNEIVRRAASTHDV